MPQNYCHVLNGGELSPGMLIPGLAYFEKEKMLFGLRFHGLTQAVGTSAQDGHREATSTTAI
jgi:hypothetical protein